MKYWTKATLDRLKEIAQETLQVCEAVSRSAKEKLDRPSPTSENVLVQKDTPWSQKATKNLHGIIQSGRDDAKRLVNEPTIARIATVDGEGEGMTVFICRRTPVDIPGADPKLASYLSPVGRLAAAPLGECIDLPYGKCVEAVERAKLRPTRDTKGWDAQGTEMEAEAYGPLDVKSLRALRSRSGEKKEEEQIDEGLLHRELEEEVARAGSVEEARRTLLTRMELRDQPILDSIQDRIFRLPIDQRLVLLGPPGTGKTTTLIRRLAQKIREDFLDEDEKDLVKRAGEAAEPHERRWLMFTPTTLLHHYVKEAFAREGVAASDKQVWTWEDYRKELARRSFGLLRSAANNGGFILRDRADHIGEDATRDLTGWFDDFHAWQKKAFVKFLHDADKRILTLQAAQGEDRWQPLDLRDLKSLKQRSTPARKMARKLKAETDEVIDRHLNLQINRDKRFLDDLAAVVDDWKRRAQAHEDRHGAPLEDEDDPAADALYEEDAPAHTAKGEVINAFRAALRAQARAQANGRKLKGTGKNARVVEWLADRGLEPDQRDTVGKRLLLRQSLQVFANPYTTYMRRIAGRYRDFRRTRQAEGRWYRKGQIPGKDICALELDMLLLSTLKSAQTQLRDTSIRGDLNNPYWEELRAVAQCYRTQILVDEATDFSPVQIGCMAALADPVTRSFFACGDFNQRLSKWGCQNEKHLKWGVEGLETIRIENGYRQSRELGSLTRALIQIGEGADDEVVLPKHANHPGVPPVLGEHIVSDTNFGQWLARRVDEIEREVQELPTIAVLVPEEAQVEPTAAAAYEVLSEQNIIVVACRDGQSLGQHNDIRVFDVRHIKGLEFEAVFFRNIDQVIDRYPELFDKFIYVGATRAATYLGLTCTGTLPEPLAPIRPMLASEFKIGTDATSRHADGGIAEDRAETPPAW